MIRDRLKNTARKVLLKAFNMEWDASPSAGPPPATEAFDAKIHGAYIPQVVSGSGDTPGPNHKTNIGRTWLAAQVVSSAAPMLIDLRPPQECVAGMLPGAILLPGDQIRNHLDLLPPKEQRVVIYDQIGSDHADAIASYLRDQGWEMARRLVGGYAEWIEHDEPIEVPQAPPGARLHIGLPAETSTGQRGHVQKVQVKDGVVNCWVLLDNGSLIGPVPEQSLR